MRAIAGLVAAGALAATTLTGCQLIASNTPVHTPTALEGCAIGHSWELDTTALATTATTVMQARGVDVTVTVQGTQRLTWDTDFHMTFDTDLTFIGDVPSAPGFQEQFVVSGTSAGIGYFSGDVVVPRDWTEQALDVETTATQDGAPVDVTFQWTPLWLDDTSGLKTTCASDVLTMTARQGHLAWTFNRVS